MHIALTSRLILSVLKDGANTESHLTALTNSVAARAADSYTEITHKYDSVLHGYAAFLRGAALQHVISSKDVAYVEQNGIVSIKYEEGRDVSTEVEAREGPALVARAGGGAGGQSSMLIVFLEKKTYYLLLLPS